MNWSILGIEPTKDKKAITAAYRAQLAHTNPEDKPEEFKDLRAAYEEALRLAEVNESETPRDESPVGLWTQRIRALYDDFARRIRPENWEELLKDDICIALDTRPLAEEALLRFLMQDFYLPQGVWQVLDNAFSWSARRQELYETYPRDFVDYAVINGIRYRGNLPYEYFTPGKNGKDCDEYRRLYYQADQRTGEELSQLLAQMSALSESHPYGELLSCRLMLENGDTQQGREGYRKLADAYPQDIKLALEWTAQCLSAADWTQGEVYARRALALESGAVQAKEMLAHCLAGQKQYEEAKKLIFQLMDAAGGDQKRIYQLRQTIQDWNAALIADWEAQLRSEPEDMALRVKLAWCYLQNDRDDDAMRLCQSIDPGYEDQYDYHNLYAKVAYARSDYETALPHLQEAEKLLRAMTPDGTEQTESRMATLPEKLQIQGSCLMSLGRSAEAVEKYEQALALAPENPEVLTHMGRLLRAVGDNERAAQTFEKLTEVLPSSYHGFFLLSLTLFALGRDRDAFDAVNRALELDGGDLAVYVLKMRILLRNGAWEAVRGTLDFLREHGITDEINTLWCEAQLLEQGEGQKEKALELYRAIAARLENGEDMEDAAKLYYRLLLLEAEHLNANKPEDRAVMLALAEKGLSYDENDFPCLDYKAWLLKRDGKRSEALELYHRLEAVPRRSMGVEAELAELYYKDLDRDADKALHYYKLLMEHEPHPSYLFYAGTCCKYLARYEEGEKYFLQLQEEDSDSIDGFNGLSYLYDSMKRYEDALEQVNKVIERIGTREGNQSGYYYHKSRILRRLNRPLEAIAVIDELTEKYGNEDLYQEKFEICCQFGLWDRAAEILKAWRKSGQQKARAAAAAIDLDLFTGQIDAARKAVQKSAAKLNASDAERLQLLMGELDGIEDAQMPIWEKRAANREDKTHELMNMAQVQWWNGHYEKSRAYAQQALEQLDELIPRKKKMAALYRSRRSLVLAILGRFEEAEAELAAARALPLCEGCSYCTCKDADIYEANMEEIRGNFPAAMALYRAGLARWYDDMDFAAGVRRMMRKGL
ncbi:MAG: tetratricopeptide repeat protein [Oscillospiraceae bacterium]|nr:tetratricopeptide repeat protein [Oscillospiraceae bacterium]